MLVVENQNILSYLTKDLYQQINGLEGGFVLSHNDKILKIQDYMSCVINPFSISLNERKILNKLYELIKTEVQSSELLLDNNSIFLQLENYAEKLSDIVNYELSYLNKADVQNLIKFLDIRFVEEQLSLIEQLIEYIRVLNELLGIECFVFVHLLSFLNTYEVEKLYEFVDYQKVNILLVEGRQPINVNDYLQTIIIDKDCCEIYIHV